MKHQKALNNLKRNPEIGLYYDDELELLQKLIDLRTPMAVTRTSHGRVHCPICGRVVRKEPLRMEYCDICGQALSWKVKES